MYITVKVLPKAAELYQKNPTNRRIADDQRFHFEITGDQEVDWVEQQIYTLLTYHFCMAREKALARIVISDPAEGDA